MKVTVVTIDMSRIKDWGSFHDVFAEAMGFPSFYGRNMNAWIDCMTDLDVPENGMTKVHAPPDGAVVLNLQHVTEFAERCPEQYQAILDCSAFVNYRRSGAGDDPILFLSFWKRQ